MSDIKQEIRNFIAENLIDKKEAEAIDDQAKLLSTGLIDSISALQLVDHLEKKYSINFEAHEMDAENLETIEKIADFIRQKQNS